MGFGGGGGGQTLPHKHTNIANDGSPLDMSNVTIGSLAAGSIVYSNGAALQELVKPAVPAGESLSYPALAVAPSWVAGGGANTNRILINGATNGSTYTNTALGDVTGTTSAALSNQAGGSAFIFYSYVKESSAAITATRIAIGIGGVDTSYLEDQTGPAGYITTVSGCAACAATSGQTIQQRIAVNTGTLTLYNSLTVYGQTLTNILEVW